MPGYVLHLLVMNEGDSLGRQLCAGGTNVCCDIRKVYFYFFVCTWIKEKNENQCELHPDSTLIKKYGDGVSLY